MVNARLHLICGNCGCDDEFKWEYIPEEVDDDGEVILDENVYIICNNCATLHSINNNAIIKRKIKETDNEN